MGLGSGPACTNSGASRVRRALGSIGRSVAGFGFGVAFGAGGWLRIHRAEPRTPPASHRGGVGLGGPDGLGCHGSCARVGMMNPKPTTTLPHHQLIAYQLSIELLGLFRSLRIADARCREQARKSLVSCSLNLAEGAGPTRAGVTPSLSASCARRQLLSRLIPCYEASSPSSPSSTRRLSA